MHVCDNCHQPAPDEQTIRLITITGNGEGDQPFEWCPPCATAALNQDWSTLATRQNGRRKPGPKPGVTRQRPTTPAVSGPSDDE